MPESVANTLHNKAPPSEFYILLLATRALSTKSLKMILEICTEDLWMNFAVSRKHHIKE